MKLTKKQEQLALYLASTLGDMESIQSHRIMVVTYSEEHLKDKLAKVMAIPQEKIYKSRGAIYTTLVKGFRQAGNDAN